MRFWWAVLCAVMFFGCSANAPTNFYLLRSSVESADKGNAAKAHEGKIIIVTPVILPEYLKRVEIVTRTDDYQLFLSELSRWAEPLEDTITRMLVTELRYLTGNQNIRSPSAREVDPMGQRLNILINSFERVGDRVPLTAEWYLFDPPSGTIKTRRNEAFEAQCQGDTYAATVECMADAITMLASSVAQKIGSFKS